VAGFFDDLRTEITSAREASRARLAAEAAKADAVQAGWQNVLNPTIEHVMLALANPHRATVTTGSSDRLFRVGALDADQQQRVRTHLARVFRVIDEGSLRQALSVSDTLPDPTFANAIQLHLLAAAADVGIVEWNDYLEVGRNRVSAVLADDSIDSWATFGARVVAGDSVDSEALKARLADSVEALLDDPDSPWRVIDWLTVTAFRR